MRAGGKATPHQTGDAEGLPVNSHPEDKRLQTEISLTISIKRPEGCNGSAGRETSYINNDILAVGRQCNLRREQAWLNCPVLADLRQLTVRANSIGVELLRTVLISHVQHAVCKRE